MSREGVHALKETAKGTATTRCGLTVPYRPGETVTVWEHQVTCADCARPADGGPAR